MRPLKFNRFIARYFALNCDGPSLNNGQRKSVLVFPSSRRTGLLFLFALSTAHTAATSLLLWNYPAPFNVKLKEHQKTELKAMYYPMLNLHILHSLLTSMFVRNVTLTDLVAGEYQASEIVDTTN